MALLEWLRAQLPTQISDLWVPVLACGLVLLSLLALHYAVLSWRHSRKLHHVAQAQANASASQAAAIDAAIAAQSQSQTQSHSQTQPQSQSQSQSGLTHSVQSAQSADASHSPAPINWLSSGLAQSPATPLKAGLANIGDLNAFTAPRHPVTVHSVIEPDEPDEPDLADETAAVGRDFTDPFQSDAQQHAQQHAQPPQPLQALPATPVLQAQQTRPASAESRQTPVLALSPPPSGAAIHPQFHYQARFTWGDALSKPVLHQVLAAHPWQQPLPVVWTDDANAPASAIAAWQVVTRRALATEAQHTQFTQWCELLANLGAARVQLLATVPWAAFMDEAQRLLVDLDSVIVLKVAVPLAQLDLFAQSLLAARFQASQEHWVYQESPRSPPTVLERQWQAAPDAAVYQLILDIPHSDSLEARKVYMRLRAVARATGAVMQSAQGAHLSEGMLDRYSRELLLKQESLSRAGMEPGSALAQAVYQPRLASSRDFA
jgi:hypothetical protein